MERKITGIIKEYYDTIATLLEYQGCGETLAMERSILHLLFDFAGCKAQFETYWSDVEKAQRIQTCTDEMLLSASAMGYDILSDLKMQALTRLNISKQKKFDAFLFADTVQKRANEGRRSDCKLFACMNWLGIMIPENKSVALKIWSLLAASDDLEAMQMLICGYRAFENVAQAEKWSHVLAILRREHENFSPVALQTQYPGYSEEELELANLVLFVAHKTPSAMEQKIDRPMLTYILESGESYGAKMRRLNDNTNYSFLIYVENRCANRHFGF